MTVSAVLNNPRFTIITSTFNCSNDLEKTAQSIREQSYENIQWIIADGASTDETVNIIKKNSDIVSDWFSEPDSGIYDAWNKASQLINGDWVIFLGAGDLLANENVLSNVSSKFLDLAENVSIAYGDVLMHEGQLFKLRAGEINPEHWELFRPCLPHHQGVFQRAKFFKKSAPFDVSYRVVADSKFMLQILKHGSLFYLNEVISKMELCGVSNHPRYLKIVQEEFCRLQHDLKYKVPVLNKIIFYFLSNIKYYCYKFFGERFLSFFVGIKRNIFN